MATSPRVEHVKAEGRIADVAEIRNGSLAATAVSDGVEGDLWLIPIEDRRKQGCTVTQDEWH